MRLGPEGFADEAVNLHEILGRALRAGKHQRKGQLGVVGMEQDAEDVENFLRRAGSTRKHHDAVGGAHESLQALLDVGKNHQFADDGVGCLGSDDARLGKAQVAAVRDALLGVGQSGALHRPLHGARPAAGADVEATQAQLVTDHLGVVVFLAADRMPAPAHHQVRLVHRLQDAGIAQDVEHRVGKAFRAPEIELRVAADLVVHIDDIAQYGDQMLLDALDHLAVYKRTGRRCRDVELDAALPLEDADIEGFVAFQQLLAVIQLVAAVEHRQRTVAVQLVQAAMALVGQLGRFAPGKHFQTTGGGDLCVDDFVFHGGALVVVGSLAGANRSAIRGERQSLPTTPFGR